jgi:hypothetical protein
MSSEARVKMSMSKIGKKATPEARKNMSIAQLNRPPTTDKTRARISESSKLMWAERKAKAAFRGQLPLF